MIGAQSGLERSRSGGSGALHYPVCDILRHLAIVASSGPVAEFLHRIGRDPHHPDFEEHLAAALGGGHSDVPMSDGILEDTPRFMQPINVLESHWAGLTQVAEELLEHQRISGKRAFEILDARGRPRPPDLDRKLWPGTRPA